VDNSFSLKVDSGLMLETVKVIMKKIWDFEKAQLKIKKEVVKDCSIAAFW